MGIFAYEYTKDQNAFCGNSLFDLIGRGSLPILV